MSLIRLGCACVFFFPEQSQTTRSHGAGHQQEGRDACSGVVLLRSRELSFPFSPYRGNADGATAL